MKCRHLNTISRAWNRVHGHWYEAHWDIAPDAHVCLWCREWLPLGESNDADERVKVVPGADRFDYCPETKSDELCALCERHYLTHAIAKHPEGP